MIIVDEYLCTYNMSPFDENNELNFDHLETAKEQTTYY